MIWLFRFLKQIYNHRSMIKIMVIREFQSRYVGTMAGFVWSVINPLMMILIYWFVFSVGFKVQLAKGIPFIITFLCGLISWIMFSETLMSSVGIITANVHLIKKTVFPTEILPVVSLFTASINHGIMLIIFMALMLLNNIPFSFYNFQFLYYFVALLIFTLGLGWLFSTANVFFRDIGQILGMVLNMWFWLTPIVWPIDMIPQKYQYIIKLNPMYYIVEGYKSSFIYHVPFWHNYRLGIYFWSAAIFVFFIGGFVFRRLKPEFADVL